MGYLIGVDQSTQGTKAIVMDRQGRVVSRAYLTHRQIISDLGWVSHDPEEIYTNTCAAVRQAVVTAGIDPSDVEAVGISNQRETSVAWDRETGRALQDAVVWQCSRAASIAEELERQGAGETVRHTTGIPLSPYFPAAKYAWLLRNSPEAPALAKAGRLCFGTVDSWLVFRLTEGRSFRTDWSNASRTQLLDLRTLRWSEEICALFGIPVSSLPEITDSDGDFGETTFGGALTRPAPIRCVMGDSHAALFGQGCETEGMAKATYGTGSSVMMNAGREFRLSDCGLVTSLAWGRGGQVEYVLEGNINYTGAVVTWLQDDVHILENAAESETLARSANGEDGAYFVPAFTGLGAPYWSSDARALLCGVSRTTGRAEIVKAGLESIAYQITDILEAMAASSGLALEELRVDGGPTKNGYLMQFQSDIARLRICKPKGEELSILGVTAMAGLALGYFEADPRFSGGFEKIYEPEMSPEVRDQKYSGWRSAVRRAMFET